MASKWSGAFAPAVVGSPAARPGQSADDLARTRYLGALRSNAPAGWMSSHLTESWRLRGAVYVAIKVLADQASQAEVKVFRWHEEARADGDTSQREPLPRSHSLSRMLHRPNKHESGGMLRRRMVQQLSLTGTSLLWRVDDGLDRPAETWSVPTGTYTPVPISETYPDGAYRIMPYFPGPMSFLPGVYSAGGVVVDASQMVVTRHPHPLVQAEGLSPLSACDLAMDTLEQIDRARFTTMRRGIHPSGVVELQAGVRFPDEPELTRISHQLSTLLGGPEKSGAIAVLGEGMGLKPWSGSTVEVGWVQSWEQLVGFVLAVFGVTKSLAFMQEDTSYAALYAGLKQHALLTMTPLLGMIADAINMQLVWPFWGEDYCVEFIPRKIDDEQLTEQQLANDLRAGIRTINEVRALRQLEPVDWGKTQAIMGSAQENAHHAGGWERTTPSGAGPDHDPDLEKTRPRNDGGGGSLPPQLT